MHHFVNLEISRVAEGSPACLVSMLMAEGSRNAVVYFLLLKLRILNSLDQLRSRKAS